MSDAEGGTVTRSQTWVTEGRVGNNSRKSC
jgi:hypothetical protein